MMRLTVSQILTLYTVTKTNIPQIRNQLQDVDLSCYKVGLVRAKKCPMCTCPLLSLFLITLRPVNSTC